jgi:hypothetical protein
VLDDVLTDAALADGRGGRDACGDNSGKAAGMCVSQMKHTMLVAMAALAVGAASTAHADSGRTTAPSGLGVFSAPVTASAPAGGTAASLDALLTEWDQAGFSPPSKPSQFRVYGRNGYVTSGSGYNTMVALIRSAQADVQQGRDREAANHIAKARSLLAGVSSQQPVSLTDKN